MENWLMQLKIKTSSILTHIVTISAFLITFVEVHIW
jgi:hypothetical protein